MPRLGPTFANSVFFLFEKDGRSGAAPDAVIGPKGTGVIVAMWGPDVPVRHFYAVSAAHTVSLGASIIKLNTGDGKSRLIDLDPADWSDDIPHEDIAAVDITDRIVTKPLGGDEFSYVPVGEFVHKNVISYYEIGVGEDGFMLGLFSQHPGKIRNLVAGRFGNVSLMADDTAPISRKDKDFPVTFESPCHIFDIHSRPGFSGSPVFVYRTPDSDLRHIEWSTTHSRRLSIDISNLESRLRQPSFRGTQEFTVEESIDPSSKFVRLFGIHVGQFQDAVEISKLKQRKEDATLRHGDRMRFPGSMTIVVPAWKIEELLLKDQRLVEQRKARNQKAKDAEASLGGVALESAPEGPTAPEDSNPSHREDFTRMLGAAVKSPRPNP